MVGFSKTNPAFPLPLLRFTTGQQEGQSAGKGKVSEGRKVTKHNCPLKIPYFNEESQSLVQ